MDFLPFTRPGIDDETNVGVAGIHTPKEGSARLIAQSFRHVVRAHAIDLFDDGRQLRVPTCIDDGVAAPTDMIDDPAGLASRMIRSVGSTAGDHSKREARDDEVLRVLGKHEALEPGRHHCRRLMRRCVGGYAGAGFQRGEHNAGTGLGAAVHDGRRPVAYLRCLPLRCRRGAAPDGLTGEGR